MKVRYDESMKQANILIVEDDRDLNEAYRLILEKDGHKVQTAFDGQQALERLKDGPDPDIILLDLRMPVMDGIEFLKEYKPDDHNKTTVVVFSNYDAQKEVDEAYELGAHRYVLKARAAPKELQRIVADIIG
ncbi:MAG TPA: response regulator [Candidatus Saccharimonadales bacterium]|nr:response regulator [Candidatus Saccharimonadales bacterium]